MRLSDYTDYTLRVLMYCAQHRERLVTIAEIATFHNVSKSVLMKIVNALGQQGVLETVRGRGGGIRLGADAASVRIGDVVRAAETDFRLVECFDRDHNTCRIDRACALKRCLHQALNAYFAVLDAVTLADLEMPRTVAVTLPAPTSARATDGASLMSSRRNKKGP
ncbi:MAG: Rrf2 family transcriptional regulator [Burkholderiales bacterium]|nr:Rrf2 family transcriptional regulator [Burkholderiales bacterium]